VARHALWLRLPLRSTQLSLIPAFTQGTAQPQASSAFYLPLHRVVRALGVLQRQLDSDPGAWAAALVARGDLQATFAFRGFEEVRRLGLRRDTEAAVRAAAAAAAEGDSPSAVCARSWVGPPDGATRVEHVAGC